MLSVQSETNHYGLFQPWQPDLVAERTGRSSFIELPGVGSYQQLVDDPAFAGIQAQFFSDIAELKLLANAYVDKLYDDGLDAFLNMLKDPGLRIVDELLPLYRETRFHIHQLVLQLREPLPRGSDYIASVLHECLSGIDLCPAGVHSRFATNVLDLQASVAKDLDGKLFKVRNDLLRASIQSFMFQLQREDFAVAMEMEVHWFNGLYNLQCQQLGLPVIADPKANHFLDDELRQRLSSAVGLAVNACTIVRRLSDDWSVRLESTLASAGCSAWLTRPTRGDEPTAVAISLLDSQVFNPINSLMGTATHHPLDLTSVMDVAGDDSFHLKRYREKILAWVAGHLFAEDSKVFAAIGNTRYIGTINQLFFWVFDSSRPLSIGGACIFTPDQHTSLRLSHLRTIDFSTWPGTTVFALLTQALEQTTEASEVAAFFLDPQAIGQVGRLPDGLVPALSTLLTNKLTACGEAFTHRLCQYLCDHFAICTTTVVLPQIIALLIDTPLLGPVLSGLHQRSEEISPIISWLNTWQIDGFSLSQLELLTPEDCQRLFRQAVRLGQSQCIGDLLLTGHCDGLVRRVSRENWRTPLSLLAHRGDVDGVKYLLTLPNVAINHRDDFGYTPLHLAVINDHLSCVEVLLRAPCIKVNEQDTQGFSPLNTAARLGLVDVCKLLLKQPGVDINRPSFNGWTPLATAAAKGRVQIVKELVKAPGVRLNEGNRLGCSPLHCASLRGFVDVVEVLLHTPGVWVNQVSDDGCTPLNSAACIGHAPVVKALLNTPGVDVNLKDHGDWTPLNSAAGMGHSGVVEMLLNTPDVLVNEDNRLGCAPLHCATLRGHTAIVRTILARSPDVDVNHQSIDGNTSLHIAIKKGRIEIVKALLAARGIDVNVKEHSCGMTPLHLACQFGQVQCVRALMQMPDIRVNEKCFGDYTPLKIAWFAGHLDCVHELRLLRHIPKDGY